jgi:N-methylhydantoinase A/oxoprolinase/acetone carboxylase beta subunit
MIDRLPDDELRAWEHLAQGPLDMEHCNIHDRVMSRALARLERKGLAIYSGFTPSDAAHVLGLSDHWSQDAAVFGARIWARQMRHLYGLGTWTLGDAVAPSRQVVDLVIATISQKLIEAGLNDAGHMNEKAFAEVQNAWREAMKAACAPIDAVQQASVVRRQALIAEAEQLAASEVLRVDAVKALQQRWQAEAQTMVLERRLEQKLWDAFRQPIDNAFQRKTAQREQASAAMTEHDRAVLQAAKGLEQANASADATAAAPEHRPACWPRAAARIVPARPSGRHPGTARRCSGPPASAPSRRAGRAPGR